MTTNLAVETLGWIVSGMIVVAPIAFPNPWEFAKIYYLVLAGMSLILEIERITLAHLLPDQEWVMRPKDSPCKGFIPGIEFAYHGGFVSGHEAATAFAFTLLFFAYPGVWSVLALIAASVVIFLFRYLALCHTPFQLVSGWIVGFIVAIITQKYI